MWGYNAVCHYWSWECWWCQQKTGEGWVDSTHPVIILRGEVIFINNLKVIINCSSSILKEGVTQGKLNTHSWEKTCWHQSGKLWKLKCSQSSWLPYRWWWCWSTWMGCTGTGLSLNPINPSPDNNPIISGSECAAHTVTAHNGFYLSICMFRKKPSMLTDTSWWRDRGGILILEDNKIMHVHGRIPAHTHIDVGCITYRSVYTDDR